MRAKSIHQAVWMLVVLLLPINARAECPPSVAETTALFAKWRAYMQEALDYDPHAALQDLKTEADRVGRSMEGVDGLNHFHARHWDLFEELAVGRGPEASAKMSERLSYQVAWASTSLKSLSACLALAPVDTTNINSTTIAGAATLMRYVRPNMFASIGILEQSLRTDEPVNLEEAKAIGLSLQAINGFVDASSGSFTECEYSMNSAFTRGTTISIPRAHFADNEEPKTVTLSPSEAAMTLAEASVACGRQ